jgi:hypothetical protein
MFALKFAITNWGEQTIELAIDGTCESYLPSHSNRCRTNSRGIVNTYAAGYEVSAVMAEANGQGIPLGFLFIAPLMAWLPWEQRNES